MRVITLIGPMGAGKSLVGRALAARLGWGFVDTDVEIETREGRSISALFRDSGDAHFRAVEQAAVRDALRVPRRVVATGGGAILSASARRALRQAGPVFYLRAPLEVLLERVGDDPGRPLLGADPRGALARLLHEREPLYAETGDAVDASQPVDAVVAQVVERLIRTGRRTVRVDLAERSYDVLVGAGILPLVGVDLHRRGVRGRAAIVTHRALVKRFADPAREALEAVGITARVVTVPAGERAKTLRQAAALIDMLSAEGLTRSDTIVALGGGVIGDLAGFVAGVYMRGLRLVHVPTTLLAQVDSSVGGKTAVNHPRAKNLVGVYHQPALVIADVETLASLPARECRAGLAEAVKYGMTLDRDLFEFLEREPSILTGRASRMPMAKIVYHCAALKARVVTEDEFERGPREVLNYGHTVGHAVEAVLVGRFVHGEAIAIGMSVEARIAVRLGMLDPTIADRQDALLTRMGLPVPVPPGPPNTLLSAMRLDKKRRDGRIRCTLPEGIGRARLGVEVPESVMEEVIIACHGSS